MELKNAELERYARHIVLPGVGGAGQKALKSARVVMIGAGGLGAPVLQYLSAAGVGHLVIVDDDHVSLSNLQRQIIFRTDDLGRPKADAAADAIAGLNPHVVADPRNTRITAENALSLFDGADAVVDGSDNFETRYLVADAAHLGCVPLVSGTVGTFDGYVTTFRSSEIADDGRPNPTYRCLFPKGADRQTIPPCEEAGILGALAGVIGSLMAMEVLKLITGAGDCMIGRQLLYDGRDGRFETIRYRWRPGNPLNGTGGRFRDLSHHTAQEVADIPT
ncbi:MAG: molybdopterin-synthase adenylyltransferase MoeB [Pseudomonadota bacterium]